MAAERLVSHLRLVVVRGEHQGGVRPQVGHARVKAMVERVASSPVPTSSSLDPPRRRAARTSESFSSSSSEAASPLLPRTR
jgi:hypothetical protein